MSKFLCFIIFLLFSQSVFVDSVRILAVYPVPSRSHQFFFRSITQELLNRGHELVVITPDPAYPKGQTPRNLTEIDVHDISYKIWNDNFLSTSRGVRHEMVGPLRTAFTSLSEIFKKQIRSPEIKRMLEDNTVKFDLILVESVMKEPLVFSQIYKVPVIQISTMATINGNFECVGGSSHPILYASLVKQRINNLTVWDNIVELYQYYFIEHTAWEIENKANVMAKSNFGNDFPEYTKLCNNVHLIFLNMHPIGDLNRPVPPSVNYISGAYQIPSKRLPEDLEKYLDSSKNGVIYVSFGTNTIPSSLKPHFIKIMVKVFSELPYDIMFKWDLDVLPGKPANTKIFKWLPQPDVLKHPKVKLFITQGGMQSTDEAIEAGVPLIGIPLMADQWFNTETYVKHKYGLKLEADTLTADELKTAITDVLKDESYRQNMMKFRSLVYDQPQKPMDRAMWWIDHIIRHSGASHLRSSAANITWTQYFELELIIILLVSLIFQISFIVYISRELFKLLLNLKSKTH